MDDILELLGIELLGAIPESGGVLNASNQGMPVILEEGCDAAEAYMDVVSRFVGEEQPHRFIEIEKKSIFSRLFSSSAPRSAYAG